MRGNIKKNRSPSKGLMKDLSSNILLLGYVTGGPSSSCEMIILRNKSHGEIIRVCMGIFTTALRNKKWVKFSIQIPHLTSKVHCLLSDHLLCWKEAILASYPFLGLLIKEAQGCTLHYRTPDSRSETPTSRLLGGHKQSPFILGSFIISPDSFYFDHY